jgi:hypothetical protein
MTVLNRVKVIWSGFTGAPGYSNFYFDATVTDMTALKQFLTSCNSYWNNNVSLSVPTSGDQIDSTTGQITGVWTGTGGGTVNGFGGTAAYSGSSGFLVDWKTSTIIAGRRVQGRTYFVPASANTYQTDGTIIESARTTIINAANVMLVAYGTNFKIFARPFAGSAAREFPTAKAARPARAGAAATVVAAFVPDIAAVMRSRRQ